MGRAVARLSGPGGPPLALLTSALAAAAYFGCPVPARPVLPVVTAGAAALTAVRVARRPATSLPRVWGALAGSMSAFAVFFVLAALGTPASVLNAVMGVGYALAGWATWQIAPRRLTLRRTAWFDGPIIVGSGGLAAWDLFVHPYLDRVATEGGLVAALQPALALVLLPVIVRSLLSGGARLPSAFLLLAAALFSLLADAVLSFQALRGDVEPGGAAQVLPLLSQAMVLAAALHRQAGLVGRPSLRVGRPVTQTLWLAPVGVTVVVLPSTAAALGLRADLGVAVTASAVMVLLLVGRCVLLVVGAERLATTDVLTGLASRRAFAQRLEQGVDLGERVAVLVVDLDDFKRVNDTGGHAAGDALLVEVGRRLRGSLRPGDVPARIGGDEFGVLLLAAPDQVEATGRRVAAALSRPFLVAGSLLPVTASVGVVPHLAGDDAEHLLAAADLTMYAAKNGGKDRVRVYSVEMRRELHGRRALARELAEAVAAGPGGGLALHYQPVLCLADRTVHAVEALVRWHHPRRGLLPAGAFLDLVDSADLACDLDAVVLESALRQAAAWRRDGGAARDLTVAVNLSTPTLLRPDLTQLVAAALERTGVPPTQLALEVTEHEAVPSDAAVEQALRSLAGMDVRLWVDDFGVGYTSLHYLERFPITTLKVDRSLAATALRPDPSPLLGGLVALGDGARVATLAEGVETEEQAQRLLAVGFRYGQGYHLGRPMPAEALERWIDDAACAVAAGGAPLRAAG